MFIEISILIQVLELSNMNNVCPGEIFSHPTPMTVWYTKSTSKCREITHLFMPARLGGHEQIN